MKATKSYSAKVRAAFLTLGFLTVTLSFFGQQTERYIIKFKSGYATDRSILLGDGLSQRIAGSRTFETKNGSAFMSLVLNNSDGADLMTLLKSNEAIEYVEKDEIASLCGEETVVPEDEHYYKQWAMQNNGNIPFTASKAGADIEMEKAWAIEQGDSNVIVAIIDTGVKYDHPDLKGRCWINRDEIPSNGLDDDNNGFVDDVQGWDFADSDNDPMDITGHGTNIASIIGANANNSIGFVGMDWNCKLMNLKVLNSNSAYYSWWIEAIYYAVDNGAHVLNMSLGGETESQALTDAVNYALDRNVIVVIGMGNNASDKVSYPSNVPGVIAVGSTDPDDTRSEVFNWSPSAGSNYGTHISVVAPGSYIFGLSHKDNTDYNTYFSGTSQATAYVSGLASLLRAQLPEATNSAIKDLIETTADDQVGNPAEDKQGKDIYYGNGRINAFSALLINAPVPFELKEEDVTVYPNPTAGNVRMVYPEEVEKITVANGQGKIITEMVASDYNGQELTFNETGVLFLTFIYQDQLVTKKLIVLQ